MPDVAAKLVKANLLLNAALLTEQASFEDLIRLSNEDGNQAEIDVASTSLDVANKSVEMIQAQITELETRLN